VVHYLFIFGGFAIEIIGAYKLYRYASAIYAVDEYGVIAARRREEYDEYISQSKQGFKLLLFGFFVQALGNLVEMVNTNLQL
jgi:hypothetical protein